mgnify:CR=1 FL=1
MSADEKRGAAARRKSPASKKTTKCKWCGRKDVGVNKKGRLSDHVDAGGRKCVAAGVVVAPSALTPPRRPGGVVQRNAR